MKPFKTYDEQIDILKSRNLKIKDKSKAKDILSQINYYNLINGYKDPFLIKNDKFKDNASLEEIYSLHEMDRELKQVVFSSLLRFEKLLKHPAPIIFLIYIKMDYILTCKLKIIQILNINYLMF